MDSIKEIKETIIFKQGDKFVKFPSEFPLTREFSDVILGGKAEAIAKGYVEMIEERIRTTVTDIKGRIDTFSDERDIIL